MVQKSNECCHNRPLCKHSFGKGFGSGLFWQLFFTDKNQSLNNKKVLQAKKSGSPSREREQVKDGGFLFEQKTGFYLRGFRYQSVY